LSQGINSYVVRPLNAFGFGGFLFDVEGETSVDLRAEISDHYLEDNTTVQDHIAIRPKSLTLKGYVGEVVYQGDDRSDQVIQKVTQKLTTLSAFLPELSKGASQAVDAIKSDKLTDFTLEDLELSSVNRVTDYYAFTRNLLPPTSKQEQAYLYFKALMEGKYLVSVQTPFEFMNRMAIETVTARQGEDSRFISDFSITLKEIRTAQMLQTDVKNSKYVVDDVSPEDLYQGRALPQYEDLSIVGNVEGGTVDPTDASDPLSQHLAARRAREAAIGRNPYAI
jgi:hypothetical protein